MKRVYLIGGPMGIGKTTIGKLLNERLENSVYLDGDWCWDASPFQVNEQTKAMVMDNICYLLNNFIHCDAYEHVVFSWVMHEQEIIDTITARLDSANCQIYTISLVCHEEALVQRLNKDISNRIRETSIINKSLAYLPKYNLLNTIKIDISNMTPEAVCDLIENL